MGSELFRPVTLFSVNLDNEDLINRLNNEEAFDINMVFDVVKKIIEDVLYSTFFERPEESLWGSLKFKDDVVVYECFLDEEFYNKHIGKLIDEVARKIINQIIISFIAKIGETDWNTV